MPAEWQIRHWLLAISAPAPGGKRSSPAGNSTRTIAHCRGAAALLPDVESALAGPHHATPHDKDNIATEHRTDTKLMDRTLLSIILPPAKPIALKRIQRHCA